MNETIHVPILFMIFNRPEKTEQVFDIIRKAKPEKLYISSDGPRENVLADQKLIEKTRKIVENIDWKCQVYRLYHKKNLGCSLAGKTAWDWIFESEDEMIMLEDDALVSISFFSYCQELLEKYKDDNRIAYIGGVNYGVKYGKYSYYFNKATAPTYSMASWKRVYRLYEYKMESYPRYRNNKEFIKSFDSRFIYKFYRRKFDLYYRHGGNTYDIQMVYLIYKYRMLSIIPNVNLASNIGFDYGAANTSMNPNSSLAKKVGNRPRYEIGAISHPTEVSIDRKIEIQNFEKRALLGKSIFRYSIEQSIFEILYSYYKYIKTFLLQKGLWKK